MKRLFMKIPSLFLVTSLVISLAACGQTDKSTNKVKLITTQQVAADKTITLKLWHVWAAESESNRKPFLKVLDNYLTAYPNSELEIDETEAQTYQTKIKTTAAANELPDVFYYQGGGLLKNFVNADKILCLDEYLKDGTMDRIMPGTLVNMTYGGKVYALPYTLACAVFFVNRELFEQNGIKIPETYNELVTAVKAFRAKGITPMTMGGKDLWPITQYFDIMALRDAGYQTCKDALNKKVSFEDPGILDAATKFQELVKLKAFNEGALGITRDESEVPFYEGKIPMYVNGNWTCGNINKDGSKVKGKILALKFPLIEGGKGDINDFTGGAADVFCASSSTQYKDEAANCVKYITENHSREAFLAGAGMPTWKFEFDEAKIDPLTIQVVNNTKKAKSFTLWWNSSLESKDSELYQNELVKLFALKVTPEEFCKDMQKMNEDAVE